MPSRQDLLQAKQLLSARLLRAGVRGGVVGTVRTLSVGTAVARASRNVHAVGIGLKIVAGNESSQRSIRLYVVQKLPESLLPPRDRLPNEIDGIPTDVIESPPAFLQAKKRSARKPAGAGKRTAVAADSCSSRRREEQRPIVAGISVAHRDVTAGTIGYFCRSTRHGDDPAAVHILSNNHVLANVNFASAADDIYQPGPADGGVSEHHVADLHRFVSIVLGGTAPNRVDAAIAALRSDVLHTAEICSIGPVAGIQRAAEDLAVCKHGRTTGYTEGVVTDESYDALVGMDHNDPRIVALFESQMRIEATAPYPWFGLGGDSGSLVVSKDGHHAVGLYFAGPGSGVYGVANYIDDVLQELEIQLL